MFGDAGASRRNVLGGCQLPLLIKDCLVLADSSTLLLSVADGLLVVSCAADKVGRSQVPNWPFARAERVKAPLTAIIIHFRTRSVGQSDISARWLSVGPIKG